MHTTKTLNILITLSNQNLPQTPSMLPLQNTTTTTNKLPLTRGRRCATTDMARNLAPRIKKAILRTSPPDTIIIWRLHPRLKECRNIALRRIIGIRILAYAPLIPRTGTRAFIPEIDIPANHGLRAPLDRAADGERVAVDEGDVAVTLGAVGGEVAFELGVARARVGGGADVHGATRGGGGEAEFAAGEGCEGAGAGPGGGVAVGPAWVVGGEGDAVVAPAR